MEPFATPEYYEKNFGPPPAKIADRLEAELARASRMVRAECPGIDDRIESFDAETGSGLDPDLVADVVCEMVKTANTTDADVGTTSTQQTAGPFQETIRYVNPVGDLYLSKKMRRILGCSDQVAFTVPLLGGD
jgi:hypothetical protein